MFKASGGRTYVYLWLIHVNVQQRPTQYYKAIILQLKSIKKVDLTLNVTTIKIKQKLNTRRRRQLLEVMAMLPLWLWLLLQVYMFVRLTDLCALNRYSLL